MLLWLFIPNIFCGGAAAAPKAGALLPVLNGVEDPNVNAAGFCKLLVVAFDTNRFEVEVLLPAAHMFSFGAVLLNKPVAPPVKEFPACIPAGC